jgi:protein-disulfide isomerase
MRVLPLALACAWAFCHPASADEPVASVGSVSVAATELDSAVAAQESAARARHATELARSETAFRRELYTLRVDALKRLESQKALELAAAEAGESIETYAQRMGSPDVSDTEVADFYKPRAEQIGAPLDIVKDSIRAHLLEQKQQQVHDAFYADLRRRYQAQSLLEPLRETVPGGGQWRGPLAAPVKVVEFADFQCPFCVRLEPTLQQLHHDLPESVRIEYRHLPLTNLHPEAQRAAEASVCAAEQHKFWEYHDALFALQGQFDLSNLVGLVSDLHMDMKSWRECLAEGRGAAVVRDDVTAADDLAIGGTPAVFVNGRFVPGTPDYDEMRAVVDDELRRLAPAH